MSSGLPVVAVAAGGLVDIMKDCEGITGAILHYPPLLYAADVDKASEHVRIRPSSVKWQSCQLWGPVLLDQPLTRSSENTLSHSCL